LLSVLFFNQRAKKVISCLIAYARRFESQQNFSFFQSPHQEHATRDCSP
jgi:hypothetical protein